LFQKAHEEELPVVPWGNDRAAVLEPALLNVRPLRAEASACERINGWPYTEFSANRQREGYGDRPIRIQRERDEGVLAPMTMSPCQSTDVPAYLGSGSDGHEATW